MLFTVECSGIWRGCSRRLTAGSATRGLGGDGEILKSLLLRDSTPDQKILEKHRYDFTFDLKLSDIRGRSLELGFLVGRRRVLGETFKHGTIAEARQKASIIRRRRWRRTTDAFGAWQAGMHLSVISSSQENLCICKSQQLRSATYRRPLGSKMLYSLTLSSATRHQPMVYDEIVEEHSMKLCYMYVKMERH